MAKKIGVVLGQHPIRRFFSFPAGAVVIDAAKVNAPEGGAAEVLAAYYLQTFGCDEVILFACTFNDMCYSDLVETQFRQLRVPVYQTLVGSGIYLPMRDLQEYIR